MSSTTLAPPTATDELGWLRRFRTRLGEYARYCLRVQTKDPPDLVPFDFNLAQRILASKVTAQRQATGRVRVLILKARQLGISTWVAARFFRAIHLWRHVRAMVIADEVDRATKLFDIYARFADNLPGDEWLQPGRTIDQRGKEMRLANGSELLVETAGDVKAGRSITIHRLHISEYAFWEHPVESMTALMESVPHSGSEVFIESTANGVGNDFHQLWVEAEAGENEWLAVFLPWWIDPDYRLKLADDERAEIIRTADEWERAALEVGFEWEGRTWRLEPEQLAWRRWKIRNSPTGERGFRQENPSTAAEAFLVSGAAFFDQDALARYTARAIDPEVRGKCRLEWKVRGEERTISGVQLGRSTDGWLRIWEMPAVAGHYVIGADTAEGKAIVARTSALSGSERGDRDYQSADVIRLGYHVGEGPKRRWVPPRQVAQLHGYLDPETFAEQLYGVGTLYSCPVPGAKRKRERALLAVERNHRSGITTLRRLRELGYDKLFVSRPMVAREERPIERIGWLTSGETRRPMLDQLGEATRTDALEIPCAETVREMLTFVHRDDKSGEPAAQDGCHDDRVMSLGIALEMTHVHHHPKPVADLPPMPADDSLTGY